MRALLVLLIIVGILFSIYHFYLARTPSSDPGVAPTQAISLIAVRGNLLQIAQGERGYMALNGRCAEMEELISSNTVTLSSTDRSGYQYSVECSGDRFDVKALHAPGPAGSALRYPSFVIDSTMQFREVQ